MTNINPGRSKPLPKPKPDDAVQERRARLCVIVFGILWIVAMIASVVILVRP